MTTMTPTKRITHQGIREIFPYAAIMGLAATLFFAASFSPTSVAKAFNYWNSSAGAVGSPAASPPIAARNVVVNSAANHVFFIGTDKRVYNHWWNGSAWKLNALDYSAAAAIATGNLVVNSAADHVFFIGTDKRVYNHWWNGSAWKLNALDYSAAAAIATGNLVVNSAADHVFFIGTDKRVYNHWWNGSVWKLNALDYSAAAAIATGNLVVSP